LDFQGNYMWVFLKIGKHFWVETKKNHLRKTQVDTENGEIFIKETVDGRNPANQLIW